jgi:hypothetical protein
MHRYEIYLYVSKVTKTNFGNQCKYQEIVLKDIRPVKNQISR